MTILKATTAHLAQVRRLVKIAQYRYSDYGDEDLPGLLARALAIIGEDAGDAWGFLCIQVEDRPPTLLQSAPTRAYLRSVALLRHYSPAKYTPSLVHEALQEIAGGRESVQIIVYGNERWLVQSLLPTGFVIVDRVQFFELDRLSRWPTGVSSFPTVAQIEPAQAVDLAPLAELDARTFSPLWHFGYKDMLELLLRCRVQVARLDGLLVGYAALSTNSKTEVQLARLAVDPNVQHRGIGRQLLANSIQYAATAGFDSVVLNTQTDNQRSQRLYRSFGFRAVGRIIPVLAKTIHPL